VGSLRLVPLARGLTDFEAKVLTAQLGAEGIIWQVRGVVDSVYPLGDIDVLVPLDELDAARPLLMGSPRPAEERVDASPGYDRYRNRWWFGAVVMAMATTFFFMRLLAFG
jgi:hypothetical protein